MALNVSEDVPFYHFLLIPDNESCKKMLAPQRGTHAGLRGANTHLPSLSESHSNASQLSYQGVEGYVLLAIYAWFNTKGRLFGPRTPKKLSTETLVPGSLYKSCSKGKDHLPTIAIFQGWTVEPRVYRYCCFQPLPPMHPGKKWKRLRGANVWVALANLDIHPGRQLCRHVNRKNPG